MENPTKRKLNAEEADNDGDKILAKLPKTEECTIRNGDMKLMEACLQLLERVGRSVKKLNVAYRVTGIKPLLDAIVKHCGDNITDIEFVCDYRYGEPRNTPEYKNGLLDFRSFLRSFAGRYPNLISLKIAYREKPEPTDAKIWDEMIAKIPSLKCLTVERCPKFPFESFFRVNGQLDRLTLANSTEWRIGRDFLDTIDSLLPNLTYLDMEFVNAHRPMYEQPFEQVYFKNLRSLKVRSHNKLYSNVLRFLSPSAAKLEEFVFNVAGELDDKAINMLKYYKQLKRLEFGTCVTNKQLPVLAAQVPQIETLTMSLKKKAVTGLGIVKMINDCKRLTKIVVYLGFRIYDADVDALCNPIKNKLKANEWSVGDDGDGSIAITKKKKN